MNMRRLAVTAVLAMTAGAFCIGAASAEVVLRLGHYYATEDFRARTVQKFVDRVHEAGEGEIRIQVFPAESLVKAREALQSVSQGVVDLYHISPVYFAGQVPAVNVFALPFPPIGYDDEAQQRYNDDPRVKAIFEPLLARVNVVSLGNVNSTGDAHMYFRSPVRNLEDLRGKIVRVGGGYADEAMKLLGASVTQLSAAEQFMALQTGTVDGMSTAHSSYIRFRLWQVAPYHLEVALLRNPYWVLMNKRRWDALDADLQTVMNEAMGHARDWSLEHFAKEQEELLVQIRANAKENIEMPPGELQRWMERIEPLYDKYVEEVGEDGRKLLELRAEHGSGD